MSIDAFALCRSVTGLTEAMLQEFVDADYVRPERQRGSPVFSETDVARIHLIMDLRATMQVEDDTLPIILSLLDQLYATRRQLRLVLDHAGPETRARLAGALTGDAF